MSDHKQTWEIDPTPRLTPMFRDEPEDDRLIPTRVGWSYYPICQDEGFVNCTFGVVGACQTVRHYQTQGNV